MIHVWLLILWWSAALDREPEFVRIPAGSFGGSVFARPFRMHRTEVTVEHFARFVESTGHRTAAEKAGASRTWRKPGFGGRGRQPVVHVTFGDADAYLSVSPESQGETIANRRGGSWVACEDIDGGPGGSRSPLIGLSTCYKVPARLDHRYDDIGFRCIRPEP